MTRPVLPAALNHASLMIIPGPLTSAGVFDSSGNLVRTLWSAQVDYPFATDPVSAWDGTLDDGSVAPTGTYDVMLIDSSVTYEWEGSIGNTSPDHSNVSISGNPATNMTFSGYHAYGGNINDMAITAAGEMYFVTGYDERMHTYHVTTTANPQYASGVTPQGFRDSFTAQLNCCTDGTNAYFHWWDSGGNSFENAVWGVNCATKAGITFSATPNPAFLAEYGTAPGKFIFGLAVQPAGNFIFVARAETALPLGTVYSIWTCHKTTGATLAVNTLGFGNQGRICVDPTTGNPWVAYLKETATAFTTWDRASSSAALSFSNSDRTVANNAANAVYAYSAGNGTKVYFEVVQDQNTSGTTFANPIGVASSLGGRNGQGFLGFDTNSVAFYGNSSWARGGSNGSETTPAFGVGDNIGIACDAPNKLIWMRVNGGLWNNDAGADPATGTNGLSCASLGSPIVAALGFDVFNNVPPNSIMTGNFASGSWTYAAPAGFTQIPGVTRTPTVAKLNFDAFGNLTASGVEVSTGLTGAASGISISPDGATILVADSGTQQIKAFNTVDGSVKAAFSTAGALGDSGGYANGPAVSNTRYMFAAYEGFSGASGWVAYAPDGSFWFCDAGNFRYMHFSSGNSPTYIEQIGYIPSFYSCYVCRNAPTRVFGVLAEYAIDYTKTLAPGNGSWTLVNNWAYGVPGGTSIGSFNAMRWVITGTNGRTYVPLQNVIYELTSTGYRNTGVVVSFDYIDADFNLWAITGTPSGGNGFVASGDQGQFFKNAFTGFDGSNNPTWASTPSVRPSSLAVLTPALPPLFPEIEIFNNASFMVEQTANGTIPVFNVRSFPTGPNFAIQSHFGGVKASTGDLKFTTHPVTSTQYTGTAPYGFFPPIPCFAQGALANGSNGLTDAGGGFQTLVPGTSDVFTCYRGESWANNQVFFWYHWDESGLLIGRTGCAAPYFGGGFENSLEPNNGHPTNADLAYLDTLTFGPAANNKEYGFMGTPGLAGNVANGGCAFQGGNYYLYNADEWYHGGISRWKISNVSSIRKTSTSVVWDSGSYFPAPPDPYNFLAGLPYDTVPLANGAGGWTRNPTVDDTSGGNSFTAPWLQIITNRTVVDRHMPPDISLEVSSLGSIASISYDWTRTGTGNWSLNGLIAQQQGAGTEFSPTGQRKYTYFTVLDNHGKVIIRFENLLIVNSGTTMFVNSTLPLRSLLGGPGAAWGQFIATPLSVSIVADVTAGTMTFSYGGITMTDVPLMDGTADITQPATFMFTYDSTQYIGQGSTTFVDISAMQFADEVPVPPDFGTGRFRFLKDHYIDGEYVPAGEIRDLAHLPPTWAPSCDVEPLDELATNFFYFVGPQLPGCWRTIRTNEPVTRPTTYWYGVSPNLWGLSGLGADRDPVPAVLTRIGDKEV